MHNITRSERTAFAKDCSGQFSLIFAISSSVIMAGVALAIDTSKLHKTKVKLNNIADAAALAGAIASEKNDVQRVKVVQEYIEQNSSPAILSMISGPPQIKFDDTNKEVSVAFSVNATPIFGKLLTSKKIPVVTESVVSYGEQTIHDVTVAFALDVSGSMNWNTAEGDVKIDVLKDSVKLLFQEIEAQIDDPKQLSTQLRTGMSAYNTSLRARAPMNWDWGGLDTAVGRLSAGGGTNSTPSLKYAHTQILQDRQFRKKNDPSYNPAMAKDFVVFMTDGDNNQNIWDDNSYKNCVKMRNDGIEIYSIAFASPDKGQALLMDCASPDADADNASMEKTCRGDILKSAAPTPAGMQQCRNKIIPGKKGHYFDAEDAKAFKEAFKNIGREIVESSIRIKA